uniref:Aquaporin n=1 Tax=Haptolina brevifila TaxID=156173 RepID=A0A7S2FMK1_9EUKA|mmetsp:Transcript_15612/g.31363  ORF Transcript_15612/g.31363 Transcript_15612/m.31363 type:complete len:501 (+) Transcript_15612:248-1750(+)|eukprot:CAMPEP_0174727468 /NCGR_PEP_ID=MMETSP1094-20130205/49831_1 /TAXON_ID=156173 /ORGANISM="Chrysochromulina brevifilum, Strain UTEX LB 985" /LENGTH=500 /DNA_ID=CAMNT_0015929213 /DNA_START=248 /DNA_END=1750 /DNA_ORIENTATION=+
MQLTGSVYDNNALMPPLPATIGLGSKLCMEFLGTFMLCFTTASVRTWNAPLAIGGVLMCAIYAGRHISGAHYNPAVSIAVWLRGHLELITLLAYMPTQLIAAWIAGDVAKIFVGPSIGHPVVASDAGWGALTVEFVLTFALCHTFLHVTTMAKQANNSYFGLAIGSTVLSGGISVGDTSGGAFNPAVGVLALVKSTSLEPILATPSVDEARNLMMSLTQEFIDNRIWVYFAGPLAGGVCAGLAFRLTYPSEAPQPTATKMKQAPEAIAPFIIEFVGTLLLCFTVATASSASNVASALAPASVGAMLMAQVYAGEATSGAHYNPAVTFAVFARHAMVMSGDNRFSLARGLGYVLSQLLGVGVAICVLVLATSIQPGHPEPTSTTSSSLALASETLGTFFLVTVVLQTTTSAQTTGNSYFGLAIGGTVASMGQTIGGLSGGAFNPAVGLLELSSAVDVRLRALVDAYSWVYTAGPLLGGLLASLMFRLVATNEFTPQSTAML